MKTFNDLEFIPHTSHSDGIMSRIIFNNGYGANVVCSAYTYGGADGLYELAVVDKDGQVTYDTPITNDVLGYLSETQVTDLLIKIQQL
jgi:hypothetical protein